MKEKTLADGTGTGPSRPDGHGRPHPALDRFRSQPVPEERLLIIRAPGGTGAEWFASGWAAGGARTPVAGRDQGPVDRVLQWNSETEDAEALIRRAGQCLAASSGPVAVVASPNAPIHDVAAVLPCRLADATDLLLTPAEIETLTLPRSGRSSHSSGVRSRTASTDPAELYRLTGGWFMAIQALLASSRYPRLARQSLTAPLLRWLRARDPLGWLAEAAFLPEFTEAVLDQYQPAHGGSPPSLRELATEGLIRPDDAGGWFMPELVRDTITDCLREKMPDRVDGMVRAAVEAVDRAGRIGVAVDTAIKRRAWAPLEAVLANRAAELFTADARHLRALLSRIPEPVLAQMDHLHVALRILASAGPEGLSLPLPTVEPDLRRDRMAARLRERVARKYLNPNGPAVAYGVVEISYLRVSGHYEAAADAALQLRQAVRGALDSGPLSLPLASIAEQHAGLCLHLADRLDEAGLAYTSALDLARHGNHASLEADALSKLALLSVHQAEYLPARAWLEQQERPLSQVGWGRGMVSRGGDLARAWCALAELDLDGSAAVLDRLPAEPDTDELWSAHAHVLALLWTLQGDPGSARRLVRIMRRDRPYASRAPLADRLLTEAQHYAEFVTGRSREIPGWDRNPILANLEACRCLGSGSVDGALRALSRPPRTTHQQQAVAALLRSYAASGTGVPVPGLLQEAVDHHGRYGELIDLVPLAHLGYLPDLLRYGVISQERAARLSALPQPVLTREQPPELTARERQVLDLLRQGMTRRQIAAHTLRSENTIKGQLRSLYAKLGAENAAEALDRARHVGL